MKIRPARDIVIHSSRAAADAALTMAVQSFNKLVEDSGLHSMVIGCSVVYKDSKGELDTLAKCGICGNGNDAELLVPGMQDLIATLKHVQDEKAGH